MRNFVGIKPHTLMKKQILSLSVAANVPMGRGYSLLKLTDPARALPEVRPGQFVQVRACPEGGLPLLRRPISVNFLDRSDNTLWLLVHSVGRGTAWLCSLRAGDTASVVMPLGNGFSLPKAGGEAPRHALLVGGGVGTAPLLYLGKRLLAAGTEPTFLLGGRTGGDILQKDEFAKYGPVFLTTEDGSAGEQGFVTQHSLLTREKFDSIATCGPKPMMVAVARYARQSGTPCEASLENMMACGLGACLCCVERDRDGHNVCVCKEGPVFNINQLSWLD